MANESVLKLLEAFFYFSSSVLKLTHTTFHKGKSPEWVMSSFIIRKRTKFVWCFILVVSLIISMAELYISFWGTKSKVITVLFHTFQLVLKAGVYICTAMLNIKSDEISCFFNCICKRHSIVNIISYRAALCQAERPSKSILFQVFVYFIVLSLFLLYLVVLPLVSVSFPSLHQSLCFPVLFSSCHSFMFKLYLLVIQLICLIPMSAAAPIATISCLLTIREITMTIKNLRLFLQNLFASVNYSIFWEKNYFYF